MHQASQTFGKKFELVSHIIDRFIDEPLVVVDSNGAYYDTDAMMLLTENEVRLSIADHVVHLYWYGDVCLDIGVEQTNAPLEPSTSALVLPKMEMQRLDRCRLASVCLEDRVVWIDGSPRLATAALKIIMADSSALVFTWHEEKTRIKFQAKSISQEPLQGLFDMQPLKIAG